jgi:hypothetical protein
MPAADHIYDHVTGRWSLCTTRALGHPTFAHEFNANQVNLAVITPAANRRVCVNGIYWATEANVGTASLDFLVSVIPVFRAYTPRVQVSGQVGLNISGALGEQLTFNSTTGANAFHLLINYRIMD